VTLLVYSLLERQVQHHGLKLTTRRVIEHLESLCMIETHCWDGSVLCRLTPLDDAQAQLLVALQQIIAALVISPSWTALTAPLRPLGLPPPLRCARLGC